MTGWLRLDFAVSRHRETPFTEQPSARATALPMPQDPITLDLLATLDVVDDDVTAVVDA